MQDLSPEARYSREMVKTFSFSICMIKMFLMRIKPEIFEPNQDLNAKLMQNDQTISNKYSDDNSISVASEMNTINYIFAGSSQAMF